MPFFKKKQQPIKKKVVREEEEDLPPEEEEDTVSEVNDSDEEEDEREIRVPKPSTTSTGQKQNVGLDKGVKAAIEAYQAKYGQIYDLNVLLTLNPIMIKKEELSLQFAIYNELRRLNDNIERNKD